MIASLPIELDKFFIPLWPDGQAFSTVSILGIIVLTGMDITTAVLPIDIIMKYRDKVIPREDWQWPSTQDEAETSSLGNF